MRVREGDVTMKSEKPGWCRVKITQLIITSFEGGGRGL